MERIFTYPKWMISLLQKYKALKKKKKEKSKSQTW